jgi:hypothetical protein
MIWFGQIRRISRHPEVAAKRPSKGDGGTASERASFEARLQRAPQDDGETLA